MMLIRCIWLKYLAYCIRISNLCTFRLIRWPSGHSGGNGSAQFSFVAYLQTVFYHNWCIICISIFSCCVLSDGQLIVIRNGLYEWIFKLLASVVFFCSSNWFKCLVVPPRFVWLHLMCQMHMLITYSFVAERFHFAAQIRRFPNQRGHIVRHRIVEVRFVPFLVDNWIMGWREYGACIVECIVTIFRALFEECTRRTYIATKKERERKKIYKTFNTERN